MFIFKNKNALKWGIPKRKNNDPKPHYLGATVFNTW